MMEQNLMYESIQAHYGRLVSVALPCPNVTLRDFLRHHRGGARFYWENSLDSLSFAGSGTALELMGWGAERFQTIQRQASELFSESVMLNDAPEMASPRLFGGFSFRDDFIPDYAWSDFMPAHFVLPHYQLTRQGEESWLTINAHIPFGENPHEVKDGLEFALREKIADLQHHAAESDAAAQISDITYPMSPDAWATVIQNATNRLKAGELRKVVLSRVCEIRLSQPLHADVPLDYLAEAYPDTYRFLYEPRPHHAFFGATPELLVEVNGFKLESMALAGSIRRGATPEEDARMQQALLDSEKDRYEHQLVIDQIRERLQPLTADLAFEDTRVMPLSNIHHLYTPVHGTLKQAASGNRVLNGIVPFVEALHPTPAMGGVPLDTAMKLIGDSEPVPRGWYAAPVGWIDRHLDGQFGVAIRSAVMQSKRVWLYAGAGIVADSQPQSEWDETALKFQPMLKALTVK